MLAPLVVKTIGGQIVYCHVFTYIILQLHLPNFRAKFSLGILKYLSTQTPDP